MNFREEDNLSFLVEMQKLSKEQLAGSMIYLRNTGHLMILTIILSRLLLLSTGTILQKKFRSILLLMYCSCTESKSCRYKPDYRKFPTISTTGEKKFWEDKKWKDNQHISHVFHNIMYFMLVEPVKENWNLLAPLTWRT